MGDKLKIKIKTALLYSRRGGGIYLFYYPQGSLNAKMKIKMMYIICHGLHAHQISTKINTWEVLKEQCSLLFWWFIVAQHLTNTLLKCVHFPFNLSPACKCTYMAAYCTPPALVTKVKRITWMSVYVFLISVYT